MKTASSPPRAMSRLHALVDCGCIALRAGRIRDALDLFDDAARLRGMPVMRDRLQCLAEPVWKLARRLDPWRSSHAAGLGGQRSVS